MNGWTQEDMQAAVDYYLTDLLPDPPRTNTYSDRKEWFQQLRRGPVTLSGMLEAYRRGRLDGAAASAERIKALEDALREAADDLEAEIKARAGDDLPRRVERDLAPVFRARALLKGADQ